MSDYPGLDKLNQYLSGQDKVNLVRPPVQRHDRHDLYYSKPVTNTNTWADMLGEEYFDKPERPKTVVRQPANKLVSAGQLGKMLGRTAQTIRLWTRRGYIPEAVHWSRGEDGEAKRRYTWQQAMGLVSICTEFGMLENKRVPMSQDFINKVRQLWDDCD
jgi:hypothetical protein